MSADPFAWLHEEPVAVEVRPKPRRIEPSAHDAPMAWADAAACSGMDVDRFYPGRGDVSTGGMEAADPEVAAACKVCPVLAECRDWALRHEKYGYWGGLSERSRRSLRHTLNIRLEDDNDTGDTAA